METPKPCIVLVHGAWHSIQHYEQLIGTLQGHGYRCKGVSLASTQSETQPPATLNDDTAAIRTVVLSELQTRNVVVVAHSYGGCPTNNALYELDQASRSEAGQQTYVKSLVFINAIPAPAGLCFMDMVGGKAGPMHDRRTPDFCWIRDPYYYLYNDMDPKEAEHWISLLRPQSWVAGEGRTTSAAYRRIPSYYLHCTKDNIFPVEAQRALVASAKAGGARFVDIDSLEADHTPFIGKNVNHTSDFIRGAAGEVACP